MATVENGKLIDPEVEVKLYTSIEHGALTSVASIVLHRTDSSSATGTLSAYEGGKTTGAHFLIDKLGKIYQTARVDQVCWHVGILVARCQAESNCDPQELKTITALLHEKGLSFSTRAKNLSRHEVAKTYPQRYPANSDSLGIEVVGKFVAADKAFELPTPEQLKSVKYLVDILVAQFKLNLLSDVYAHGAIARKEVSEGAQLLQSLLTGAKP
ncbi:N-acetylmuramoyl-L-alanine amidase [Rhodanobacter sp. FDAARGOS 1247]|jgi:N-acetyl-anhydromuramyl-L-alanine amidase AmpD|uniref:peptidoglycan recognition protein family protein n=1 Tax=Rhodanobacter sp. FDAARGOS 1247 TaxID=2778082 RepID=UPI0019509622|nr:peptidoglycan recognition family protein [Rhodanobacter sp. FDAARGOS 1247]QRP62775.1 N-acetylmuramoyl-L-alanine amidase [Rhodanobacter sp. FDAARGOS 1247]